MIIARRDRIRHAGRVTDLYHLGDYHETFDDLAGIYLEDSWVLGIEESCIALVFLLDAVLTPDHRAYQPPKPGEQQCWRRAKLHITSDSAIYFRRATAPPAVDASGEPDHGHIDSFRAVRDEQRLVWELAGDWGEALVREPHVRVEFEEDD
jgi:hypothetical protein